MQLFCAHPHSFLPQLLQESLPRAVTVSYLLMKSYSTHTASNIRGSPLNHLQKYPAEETVGCLPSSAAVSPLVTVVNANIPSHLTLRGETTLLSTLNIPWRYDGTGRSLLCWVNSGAHKTHPGGRCGGGAAVQMACQLRCCDSYTDRLHLRQENNPQKQKKARKAKFILNHCWLIICHRFLSAG